MKIKLLEMRHPNNSLYSITCLRNITDKDMSMRRCKEIVGDMIYASRTGTTLAPAVILIDRQLGYLELQDLDEWFQFEILDDSQSKLKLYTVTTEHENRDMSYTVRKFLILAVTETDAVNQALKEADTTLAINSEEVKGPFVNKDVLGEFIV